MKTRNTGIHNYCDYQYAIYLFVTAYEFRVEHFPQCAFSLFIIVMIIYNLLHAYHFNLIQPGLEAKTIEINLNVKL